METINLSGFHKLAQTIYNPRLPKGGNACTTDWRVLTGFKFTSPGFDFFWISDKTNERLPWTYIYNFWKLILPSSPSPYCPKSFLSIL